MPQSRLGSQIENVHVGAKSRVVSQIPAGIIRIFVEDEVVPVPVPAIHKRDVRWSNAEVEAAEPETIRASPFESPYMSGTEFAGKVPMFPGTVEMVTGVITPFVVPNPSVVGSVDVRCLRMARAVVELTVVRVSAAVRRWMFFHVGGRSIVSDWWRTVGGDVTATNLWPASTSLIAASAFLRNQEHGKGDKCYEYPDDSLHALASKFDRTEQQTRE